MKNKVALIGAGEVGGVFARGFLKLGHPVYPITRDVDLTKAHKEIVDPETVIVGVGEKDFDSVMKQIPKEWHDRLVLIQNELLPKDWKQYGIDNPTVVSVWFEKKQPNDFKEIIPCPVYGPQADLVEAALKTLGISCKKCATEEDILGELIIKNLYILTTNISGLEVGGNVGELWKEHQDFARLVANDVLDIQFNLVNQELDRDRLIKDMVKAFEGDLEHKCMGRSAPARIERAISQADEANLEVITLREIHEKKSKVVS
jgi:hypothetical protein